MEWWELSLLGIGWGASMLLAFDLGRIRVMTQELRRMEAEAERRNQRRPRRVRL